MICSDIRTLRITQAYEKQDKHLTTAALNKITPPAEQGDKRMERGTLQTLTQVRKITTRTAPTKLCIQIKEILLGLS